MEAAKKAAEEKRRKKEQEKLRQPDAGIEPFPFPDFPFPRSPTHALLPFLFGGGFPYQNRLQKKLGPLF